MIARLTLATLLLVGCGSATSHDTTASDSTGSDTTSSGTTSSTDVEPSDTTQPARDVPGMRCGADTDCMVGTPRDCCISFCGEDAVAWNTQAWAAYQQQCAVEECAVEETLACRPDAADTRAPRAVCEGGQCALR